jgi:hypothetical protein
VDCGGAEDPTPNALMLPSGTARARVRQTAKPLQTAKKHSIVSFRTHYNLPFSSHIVDVAAGENDIGSMQFCLESRPSPDGSPRHRPSTSSIGVSDAAGEESRDRMEMKQTSDGLNDGGLSRFTVHDVPSAGDYYDTADKTGCI